LSPVKNQTLLIEALQLIRQRHPAVRLHLVGDGPRRQFLIRQASQLGLSEAITWPGAISHPLLPPVYQQGHIYVQSSRHESQGMAALEGMACGLPLVATPVGVARELACQPPSESAAGLAEGVLAALQQPDSYFSLRQQARANIEEHFSLSHSVATFRQLYEYARGVD
jgi:glycosyltransferase involved in cell wall biosynthesis